MSTEYMLLNMRLRHENALKHHRELDQSYRKDTEYKFAAHRLNLYNQKYTIQQELDKMPPSVRTYYLHRIKEISDEIRASQKAHSNVKTVYEY